MKILFYDAKQYDIESFNKQLKDYPEITVDYIETDINERTASLADGYDAICAFVSSDLGKNTIKTLGEKGISLILMRCAGFNNVDLATADDLGITVLRVPGYSPEAVAEHAICDELAKENANIKVLHKQNGGVSSARNAGLELAKGDYIAFIDSDDSIKKGYFTDLLAKIGSAGALVLSINDYKVPKPFILSGQQALEFMLKDKAHRFGWAPWNKLSYCSVKA